MQDLEKVEPLHDYVLGRRAKEEVTAGGIVLADGVKGHPWKVEVLRVGPGNYVDGELITTELCPGDVVYVPPFAGFELRLGADTYVLLREADVLVRVVQ